MSWPMRKIGDVCDVIPGFAFKSNDLGVDGIPVIKIGNITESHTVDTDSVQHIPVDLLTEKHKKFYLRNGDILIAMTGATAGKVGRIHCAEDQLLLLNQRVAKFDPKGINRDFFWFTISTSRYRTLFYGLGGGAAQPNMSGAQIEAVEIQCPPTATQQRIASILSAYDDLIENNRRRIQLLEQAARLLYKEWFVHLRFPGHEHVKIKDGVPVGWERQTLTELAVSVSYGFTASSSLEEIGPKFLRITDIVPSVLNWDDVPFCEATADDIQRNRLEVGDVVVARTGATVGYAKLISYLECQAVYASYLVRFRFRTPAMSIIAGVFMESDAYKDHVRNHAGGAAQPNANAKVLGSAVLLMPPQILQEQFSDFVRQIFLQRDTLLRQNLRLSKARDLLLPRLMHGGTAV